MICLQQEKLLGWTGIFLAMAKIFSREREIAKDN
jgi:hypothetical protein